MVLVNGPTRQALRILELGKFRRVLCLRRRPNECWADHMKRTGVIVVRQLKKQTGAHCRLAGGELSE